MAASSQGLDGFLADDKRFAELLKPIKDLTVNWEVPLASYLDHYIAELRDLNLDLQSSGSSGQTKVNFVEAALLLQGTASVYSKKVEFLWQNVLKMLDLVSSQKALQEATGPDGQGGDGKANRRTRKGHDFNDFTPVEVEPSKNIKMKTDYGEKSSVDAKNSQKDRKIALNFITATPTQLIEKEGREQKSVRVNIYAKNEELLGHKEDFRVNSQFTLATCMVGEDLNTECDLVNETVSLCEEGDSFLETSLLQPAVRRDSFPIPTEEPVDIDQDHLDDLPGPDPDDDDVRIAEEPQSKTSPAQSPKASSTSQNPVPDVSPFDALFNSSNNSVSTQRKNPFEGDNIVYSDDDNPEPFHGFLDSELTHRRSKRTRRNKFNESLNEPKASLSDPWEPIKPHEAIVPPKPIKKGRTCKAPADIALKRKTSRKKKNEIPSKEVQPSVMEPIEQYLIHEMVSKQYSSFGKLHGLHKEYEEAGLIENEARKKLNQGGKISQEQRDTEEDKNDNNDNEDNDGWEDFQGGVDHLEDDDIVTDDVRNEMTANALSHPEPLETDEGNKDSYEELVMKRVAEYVQQSQEYIASTDLAKRVSKWHENIRPKLEQVEKRGAFDIHKYGSDILSSFPDGNAKTTVNFTEVVKGKEREEVCRYFLSSLMLANAYNIELSTKDKEDSKIQMPVKSKKQEISSVQPMDTMELTLLSRKMHHEQLMACVAPEEEETNKKRKSAKRKNAQET